MLTHNNWFVFPSSYLSFFCAFIFNYQTLNTKQALKNRILFIFNNILYDLFYFNYRSHFARHNVNKSTAVLRDASLSFFAGLGFESKLPTQMAFYCRCKDVCT